MLVTNANGFKGEEPLGKTLRSPTLMGYGKGGEIWICVSCYEGVLDDKLYKRLLGNETEQAGPHPLIQW